MKLYKKQYRAIVQYVENSLTARDSGWIDEDSFPATLEIYEQRYERLAKQFKLTVEERYIPYVDLNYIDPTI